MPLPTSQTVIARVGRAARAVAIRRAAEVCHRGPSPGFPPPPCRPSSVLRALAGRSSSPSSVPGSRPRPRPGDGADDPRGAGNGATNGAWHSTTTPRRPIRRSSCRRCRAGARSAGTARPAGALFPTGGTAGPNPNRTPMIIAGIGAALIVLFAMIFAVTRDSDDEITTGDSTLPLTIVTSSQPPTTLPGHHTARLAAPATTTPTTAVPATTVPPRRHTATTRPPRPHHTGPPPRSQPPRLRYNDHDRCHRRRCATTGTRPHHRRQRGRDGLRLHRGVRRQHQRDRGASSKHPA